MGDVKMQNVFFFFSDAGVYLFQMQVVLVQRCLRPRSRVEDEEHTSEEIKQLVARIQG